MRELKTSFAEELGNSGFLARGTGQVSGVAFKFSELSEPFECKEVRE
jgi:hypothetical protein